MADNSSNDGAKRVTRTGIALVHEGELVLPAAGSEAEAVQAGNDARASIQYYFPVEIEVVSCGHAFDPQKIADLTLDRLARSVRAKRS
jgi:hypothetical protein